MAKVAADKIDAAITKALKQYGDEVQENLDAITKIVAQGGAKELQNRSKQTFGGNGKYAKGWTVSITNSRITGGTTATIHNKTPGLPHLLENGHAKRNGGRVSGKAHIAPVEQELIEKFERDVRSKL